MRRVCIIFLMVFCLVGMLVSCKPSLPSDVISKSKMTDILYDYHVAIAMSHSGGKPDGVGIAYREAVFRKHDVTSAEFDSSMVYYMRHTELLHDIYKELSDRLGNEAIALGGSSNGSFDNLGNTGDTANIWNAARSMVFFTYKPFNNASFSIKEDSLFKKGDRLMLDFDAQFIFQDGMRDGVAMLAVQFKNDSVAQQVVHVQSSQHYSLEIVDNDSLGIKCVKGYFLLGNGDYTSDLSASTTLKLMFVDNIRLIRMHPQKVTAPAPGSNSALSSDSAQSTRETPSSASVSPSVSHEPQTAPMSNSQVPANAGPRMLPPGQGPIKMDNNAKLRSIKVK